MSARTAGFHLAKLLVGGLLSVEREGRHRCYRLAGPDVSSLLRLLASFGPSDPVRHNASNRDVENLCFARCYDDHLAGSLGVGIIKAMVSRGYQGLGDGKAFIVTAGGAEWFSHLELGVARITPGRCGVARQCLDWTERDHHLAGPLGTLFLAQACVFGWFQRLPSTRAVKVTPKGWQALNTHLDLERKGIGQGLDVR